MKAETNRWIPIKDKEKLPPYGKDVVVGWADSPWHKDGRSLTYPGAAYRVELPDGWGWYSRIFTDHLGWEDDEYPSHWTPWAEPPKWGEE